MPVILLLKVPQITEAMMEAAAAVVQETTDTVKDRIETLMMEPKSGVKYAALPHVSSAPGQAPAIQFGDLLNSIHTQMERSAGVATSYVYSDLERAAWLELGTGRIAPRPAWTVALESMREEYYREIGAAMLEAATREGL
jgi:hypothetical protein